MPSEVGGYFFALLSRTPKITTANKVSNCITSLIVMLSSPFGDCRSSLDNAILSSPHFIRISLRSFQYASTVWVTCYQILFRNRDLQGFGIYSSSHTPPFWAALIYSLLEIAKLDINFYLQNIDIRFQREYNIYKVSGGKTAHPKNSASACGVLFYAPFFVRLSIFAIASSRLLLAFIISSTI